MMTYLFMETIVNADSDTISKLAAEGVPGIVIAMIIAFAAMFVISRWLDVRRDEKREIKKDKELTQMKIEENQTRIELNKTLNQLANNVKEMTFMLNEHTKSIKESVRDVSEKIDEVHADVERISSTVMRHGEIIADHGRQLEGMDVKPNRRRKDTDA